MLAVGGVRKIDLPAWPLPVTVAASPMPVAQRSRHPPRCQPQPQPWRTSSIDGAPPSSTAIGLAGTAIGAAWTDIGPSAAKPRNAKTASLGKLGGPQPRLVPHRGGGLYDALAAAPGRLRPVRSSRGLVLGFIGGGPVMGMRPSAYQIPSGSRTAPGDRSRAGELRHGATGPSPVCSVSNNGIEQPARHSDGGGSPRAPS
jgi:hypothetical protein